MTYQITTNPETVYTAGSTIFSVSGAGDSADYRWSLGDGTNTTEPSPTHIYRNAGTYIVTAAITENGETTTIAKDIVVSTPTPPAITISESGDKYVSSSISFSADITGGEPSDYTRVWDFGDGATTTAETPAHTYQRPGTYTVYLSVSSNTGAIVTGAAKTITIAQPSPPTVTVSASASRRYTPATITFTGHISGGDPADYVSAWTFENGETISNINGDTAPTATRDISSGGAYRAVLTVSTHGGAFVRTAEAEIRIIQATAPAAVISLSRTDPICEETEITANVTLSGGAPEDYWYFWRVTDSNPYHDSPQTPESAQHTFATGRTLPAVFTLNPSMLAFADHFVFSVEIRNNFQPAYNDGGSLYNSITRAANIYAVEAEYPVPVITAAQISTYIAQFANVTEYINTTPEEVIWNFGDGTTKQATGEEMRRITHTYAATGVYTVTATLVYPSGTEHTAETTAILYALAAPASARSMFTARRHLNQN